KTLRLGFHLGRLGGGGLGREAQEDHRKLHPVVIVRVLVIVFLHIAVGHDDRAGQFHLLLAQYMGGLETAGHLVVGILFQVVQADAFGLHAVIELFLGSEILLHPLDLVIDLMVHFALLQFHLLPVRFLGKEHFTDEGFLHLLLGIFIVRAAYRGRLGL